MQIFGRTPGYRQRRALPCLALPSLALPCRALALQIIDDVLNQGWALVDKGRVQLQ